MKTSGMIGRKFERADIFPVARKNKEMAVTDAIYQITAICASAQIVVRQHVPKKEECPDTFASIQAYYEKNYSVVCLI